jgi:hypothetical protein
MDGPIEKEKKVMGKLHGMAINIAHATDDLRPFFMFIPSCFKIAFIQSSVKATSSLLSQF